MSRRNIINQNNRETYGAREQARAASIAEAEAIAALEAAEAEAIAAAFPIPDTEKEEPTQ